MQMIYERHDDLSTVQVHYLRDKSCFWRYNRVDRLKQKAVSSSEILMRNPDKEKRNSEDSSGESRSVLEKTSSRRLSRVVGFERESTAEFESHKTIPQAKQPDHPISQDNTMNETLSLSAMKKRHNCVQPEPTISVLKHIDQRIRRIFGSRRKKQSNYPATLLRNDIQFQSPTINAPPLPKPAQRAWRPQSVIYHTFPEESEREIQEFLERHAANLAKGLQT